MQKTVKLYDSKIQQENNSKPDESSIMINPADIEKKNPFIIENLENQNENKKEEDLSNESSDKKSSIVRKKITKN